MRLVVITPGYAPTIGGVETVVTRVSTALVSAGVTVEVWTHRTKSERTALEEADGITVRRFATVSSARYPLSPQLWRHAARHLRDADVVHAHSYHSTAALGLLAASATGPVVLSPHYHGVGHTRPAGAMHQVYRPIGRRLLGRADAVVAVSEAEQELITRDFQAVAGRVCVVHNGADCDGIGASEPWPDEPPTALAVGRLEPYKRVDLTIRAFAAARTDGQLVVIGDGPDRARLQAMARATGRADAIRFLGRVGDADMARWWRTARVTVTMSEHEAFGLVALEAVAGGGTVLLSDIAAHREVAGLVGDHCVVVADDEALVVHLQRAMQGDNPGPRRVRSWADVAADYRDVYERLLVTG